MSTAKPTSRCYAALIAAASGLTLPISGIFLHLARHTQGPHVEGGHLFMMTHIILGVVFATAVVWHLVLNRRALACHLRVVGLGRKTA